MNITVLDGLTTNPGDLDWGWLEQLGSAKIYDRTAAEDILPRCLDADIIITNKTPLSADVLRQLKKLKYIGLLSTGYNIVDCEEAKRLNIPVTNVPAYSTNAVAQLVFAFILEFASRAALHSDAVHAGEWAACPDFCFTKAPLWELEGKTIGIIGYGSIGRRVCSIAEAFGMKALIHTPHPGRFPLSANAAWASLDDMLAGSDIVTLHCPLTEKTQGMVSAEFLSKMRSGAILINTSRGPVVNEADLAHALNNGIIAGAGLDVLEKEPPNADSPILTAKNCLITPHIAWAAYETRQRLLGVVKNNLTSFLDGKAVNVVNSVQLN